MSQNTPNQNQPRKSAQPVVHAARNPLDMPAPDAPVGEAMLFEATDALIRALMQQSDQTPEPVALADALMSEVMAPFDAPAANQAVEFLRRLGYLSLPAQAGQQRKAA